MQLNFCLVSLQIYNNSPKYIRDIHVGICLYTTFNACIMFVPLFKSIKHISIFMALQLLPLLNLLCNILISPMPIKCFFLRNGLLLYKRVVCPCSQSLNKWNNLEFVKFSSQAYFVIIVLGSLPTFLCLLNISVIWFCEIEPR